MIKKIIHLKKYKNIYNFKAFEVYMALIVSIIGLAFMCFLNLYDDFFTFIDSIKSLVLYVIAAYIGLIGITLSGVAIIVSVISSKLQKKISEINKENVIEYLLYDFVWLSMIVSFQIVIYIFIYFALSSNSELVSIHVFYTILALCMYLFFYTVFSIVSIIAECISIFNIANTYNELIENDFTISELANEVRIDFIFNSILSKSNKDEFLNKIIEFTKACGYEKAKEDALIKYFKQYYSM